MRQVVDTNFLRDPELETYLSAAEANIAVVTEFAAIESYDGSVRSLLSSMEILSRYPRQVLVLKNISPALFARSATPGSATHLISDEFTKGFPRFADDVQRSIRGDLDADALAELKSRATAARDVRDFTLKIAKASPAVVQSVAAKFDRQQRKALLNGPPYPEEVAKNLILQTVESVEMLLAHLPGSPARPTRAELLGSFVFRYSLTSLLSISEWVSYGAPSNVAIDTYRNDLGDASILTFATYFDGLLSKDNRARKIYERVNGFLRQIGD